MNLVIFHWLVVLAVILIFFGGKRIPEVMKGFGEGIRSFKEGMMRNCADTPSAAGSDCSEQDCCKGEADKIAELDASAGASPIT